MPGKSRIAILSATCRFPDANSPGQLLANIVEGRRSFRTIPPERLDIGRYSVSLVGEAESITPIRAGLLADWSVDRRDLRIPNKTFAATDLTHWLALELSAAAIASIGGPGRLNRAKTAVIVANTLTGEFSRAALLRQRLPFLDDVLSQAGDLEGLPKDLALRLRGRFAEELRRHFPEPNEDSLAGGLANTIAGRIANYFDLGGGAFSVDGACASSLVALADAANMLVTAQADAVVVTAVDLSLDPFELIGFSRNGALAADTMRVFDARAHGFWPGEGGACVLVMLEDDAVRRGLPLLARLRGWGLSSDGAGGLTRPSREGQLAAYRRAYAMAEVDPADLAFVEAHGTGTAVGDPIEVRALAALRDGAHTALPIGSIKANIGHTKAAAGLAGLVKAIESLRHGLVPPHVSCEQPHPVFDEIGNTVRPSAACELIDDQAAALAGVSSFGFGGINAHVVLERVGASRRPAAVARPIVSQDSELFVFSGDSADEVVASIAAFETRAATLSMSELADAAAHAAAAIEPGSIRVAAVARDGAELADTLARGRAAVIRGETLEDSESGLFVGRPSRPPRIGFLFPGQGAPCRPDGGAWRRRFGAAAALVARLPATAGRDLTDTGLAQPGIVAASLAALHVLEELGVEASIAVGHSLGEITALAWAGAIEHDAALDLAQARGSIMARFGSAAGAMLRVAMPPSDAEQFALETGVVVACRNGEFESVLSGSAEAIAVAAARCGERGIEALRLAVSHAFHSPLMKAASAPLAEALANIPLGSVKRCVVSTVSGKSLTLRSNVFSQLVEQIVKPVLFDAALARLAKATDCLVEVGPGQGLSRLAKANGSTAFSVDALGDSMKPLLVTAGALFAAGANVRIKALFDGRNVRGFDLAAVPEFLASPCGSYTAPTNFDRPASIPPAIQKPEFAGPALPDDPLVTALQAIADEVGSPVSAIGADDRFLDTLHLNSLAVTRIVRSAASTLGIRSPSMPTEFANATARELAETLAELRTFEGKFQNIDKRIVGVRPWVRTYAMRWRSGHPRPQASAPILWCRIAVDQEFFAAENGASPPGLLIWIDKQFEMEQAECLVGLISQAARTGIQHLAICHNRAPIAGFARSIAREAYFQSVRIIDRMDADAGDPRLATVLSSEVCGYYEVRLPADAEIEEPFFAPVDIEPSPFAGITKNDVVVVIGGGKGIAAECALRAASCGAALVLVGRSPVNDPVVAATLARCQRQGLRCRYVSADVLKPANLTEELAPIFGEFGSATTLIYAAATNRPRRLVDLDDDTLRQTLYLKTIGLQSAMRALGPGLRRLITFGSIIGRIGLEGEAHYALANAMQSAATEAWAAAESGRSALAIEWSVWGGIGMGERLGTIERLSAQGVDAISVDDALSAFDRLIAGGAHGVVAVTSRFGPPPDLSLDAPELPLLRFVEEPRVHFPGVEFIVETTLSAARDLYLGDHVIAGHSVMPAVMGLEAMAQVASVLAPLGSKIVASNLTLARAVNIPSAGVTRIRIAALRGECRTTEVHLFADDDGFAAPCMQVSFSTGTQDLQATPAGERLATAFSATKLYGSLFFNRGRFQRLDYFEIATSRRVVARLRPDGGARWFGVYEPSALILWDPGATDAALHALQVAIPHRRTLPVSAERIEINSMAGTPMRITAIERKTFGKTYTFDLLVSDDNGRVGQRWTNVTFHTIEQIDPHRILEAVPALATPYLERAAREGLGVDSIEVSLVCNGGSSRKNRREAAFETLRLSDKIDRRIDGRPVRLNSTGSISIAHRGDATLAVAADRSVSCDMEDTGDQDLGIDEVRQHAVLEVCRKLGRRPSPASIARFMSGTSTRVEDIAVMTLELPLDSGCRIVALGHLEVAPAVTRSSDDTYIREVVP
jgi:enediyne polyketide synthase